MEKINLKLKVVGVCIASAFVFFLAMYSIAYAGPVTEGRNATDANNKASTDISICQDLTDEVDADGDGVPDSPSLEGIVTVPARILSIVQKDGTIQYPTSGMEVINDSAYTIHLSSLDYEDAKSGMQLIQKTDDDLAHSTYWSQMTMDGVSGPQNFDMKLMSAKSTITKDRVFVGDKAVNIDDSKSFTMSGRANTKGLLIPASFEEPLKIGTLSWWFGAGAYTPKNIVKLLNTDTVKYTDISGTELSNFACAEGSEIIIYANVKDTGENVLKLKDQNDNEYLPDDGNKFTITVNTNLELTPITELEIPDILDEFTIPQLKEAAKDLEKNGESSRYYSVFYKFMEEDQIWWCNSNGHQPSTCTTWNSSSFDISKANQDYVCNYTHDNDVNNINNYPIFRVIGVLHDYKAGTTTTTKEKAGLTFQYIHSVPEAAKTKYEGWWGISNPIRTLLQEDGSFYEDTNLAITSNIQEVDKWYQTRQIPKKKVEINISQDKMFVPSYSEIWFKDQPENLSAYTTYNNTETFNEYNNPICEGYLYEWYKINQISAKNSNNCLYSITYTNSNEFPESDIEGDLTGRGAWTRSFREDYGGFIYKYNDTLISNVGSTGDEFNGVAPCFCF